MPDIKSKIKDINPRTVTRDVSELVKESGNIYETLAVISNRSKQIGFDLKKEVTSKLNEFADTTESIEEVHENKEQIEISKCYERLAGPVLIALDEYLSGETHYRKNNVDEDDFSN